MTWTLLTTWPSFLTHNSKCRIKPTGFSNFSTCLGLNIHRGKSKVLEVNASNNNPITLAEEALEEVDRFTYLGSIVDKQGGTEADIKIRTCKARAVFNQLKNVWGSGDLTLRIKIRIFNTLVKPVLLYGAETWRITAINKKKIQSFINACLRKILRIRWPKTIRNDVLWQRTNQLPVEVEILQRKWKWIDHTLRKPVSSITRQALTWNPQGRRRRGRPRNTWRRDLEEDTKKIGYTWGQLERLALDRDVWKALVSGLCPSRDDRQT